VEIRDVLPRSTIGKILKKDLRAPYWQKQKEKS
jgi:acyl-CoA synthetase (AMP-forming)/AMP-acid ligase II